MFRCFKLGLPELSGFSLLPLICDFFIDVKLVWFYCQALDELKLLFDF
jgi:hypothetical protein